MERSLEPLNIAEPDSLVNWHERFALYAITNDRINDDNRVAFYLTLIGRMHTICLRISRILTH